MKIYKNGELVEPKEMVCYNETRDLDDIFCMSNMRGCKVKVPHKLPFSFYFSRKNSSHAIRVKVLFNPNRIRDEEFGVLELHSNWEFTPGPDDRKISNKEIREMKQFFQQYKVLFAAVWEMILPDDAVQFYLSGVIPFNELLTEFEFYEDYQEEIDDIDDIEELESFVRKNHLFNMWD